MTINPIAVAFWALSFLIGYLAFDSVRAGLILLACAVGFSLFVAVFYGPHRY